MEPLGGLPSVLKLSIHGQQVNGEAEVQDPLSKMCARLLSPTEVSPHLGQKFWT